MVVHVSPLRHRLLLAETSVFRRDVTDLFGPGASVAHALSTLAAFDLLRRRHHGEADPVGTEDAMATVVAGW